MAEKTGEHPDDADKKDLQGEQYKRKQGNDHSKQTDNKLTDFFYHVFHDISLYIFSLLKANGYLFRLLSWSFSITPDSARTYF